MGRKQLLTKEYVDSKTSPATGELWFPDTEVRGFGLRLWAGPRGGGAAYCLRAKDADGCWTRRQFKPWVHARPGFDWNSHTLRHPETLGDWLDDARDWARTERLHLRGERTDEEKRWDSDKARRSAMESAAFGDVLRDYLATGKGKGFTDGYRDMIAVAIDSYIPEDMLRSPLGSIDAEAFIRAIVAPERPISVVRALRAFVSKVVSSDFTAHAGYQLKSRASSDVFGGYAEQTWGPEYKQKYEKLEWLVDPIKALLEKEAVDNVSAAFLRVYLFTGAKQKPLMRARWSQILDGHLYPYMPESRSSWFWARERISPELASFLDTYRQALRQSFGDTDLMFPSRQKDGTLRPITSIQRYWRSLLRRVCQPTRDVSEASLNRFAEMITGRNAPSYFMNPNNLIFRIFEAIDTEELEAVKVKLSKCCKIT